jgi:hypothetical protein
MSGIASCSEIYLIRDLVGYLQRETLPVVVMTTVIFRFLLKKRRLKTEAPSELVPTLHVPTALPTDTV